LNATEFSRFAKEPIEESVVVLDPEVTNKINMQCKNIIQEYEQMQNVDVRIYIIFDRIHNSWLLFLNNYSLFIGYYLFIGGR